MNIIQYNYNYNFFNDILSKKMEVRSSTPSQYETALSRAFNIGVIDRTGMPRGINSKSLFPIPSFIEGITLEQAIADSVERIKKKVTMPITVVFDGSIDNLLVIKSLHEASMEFTIRTEQNLFDENKILFDLLHRKIKIDNNLFYGGDVKVENIISSTLGKVINGCDYVYDFMRDTGEFDEGVMNESIDVLIDYLRTFVVSDVNKDFKTQIDASLASCPFEISTVYQALHWLSFNMAYQGLWFEKMDNSPRIWKAKDSVINFYHTDMFQRYAMNKIKEGYKGFKSELIEHLNPFYDTTKLFNQVSITSSDIRFIGEDYTQFRDTGLF